jgi:nucleoside 2-deoxyribosyltransferase
MKVSPNSAPKKVYLSGPLTAFGPLFFSVYKEKAEEVAKAYTRMATLQGKDIEMVVPHSMTFPIGTTESAILGIEVGILATCDAILYIDKDGRKTSKGTRYEHKYARKHGIKEYWSIEDLLNDIK